MITILSAHVNTAVYTLMCHWSLYSAQFYTSTFPGSKWAERAGAFLSHITLELYVSEGRRKNIFGLICSRMKEVGWSDNNYGVILFLQDEISKKTLRKCWLFLFCHNLVWEHFSDPASCLRRRLRYVFTLHKTNKDGNKTALCLRTFLPLCFPYVCGRITTSDVWKKTLPKLFILTNRLKTRTQYQ